MKGKKGKWIIICCNLLITIFATFSLIYAETDLHGKGEARSTIPSKVVPIVEEAKLVLPPNVPPAITRTEPATVVVNLTTKEVKGALEDGVEYKFWTFNGTVPGPMIRVREGDQVEIHIKNAKDNIFPHNIDIHAVNGPGGGAVYSSVAPGEEKVFAFAAIAPGLYIYHCATTHIPSHIANGMYGMILVEPKQGLPKVDKEYYVVQSEFYTDKKKGTKGLMEFDIEKAINEHPEYVVFNGKVGGVTGEGGLTARVGDVVRVYFGNGGPNLISSFHIIGEIFDNVYLEGGTIVNHNVQTTLVPVAGSAIVEFKVDTKGTYVLVDHSIFRAIDKGAVGLLNVEGEEALSIIKPIK